MNKRKIMNEIDNNFSSFCPALINKKKMNIFLEVEKSFPPRGIRKTDINTRHSIKFADVSCLIVT